MTETGVQIKFKVNFKERPRVETHLKAGMVKLEIPH
jgi:hypothetical protein